MGDFQITSVGAEVLAAADVVLLAVPDGQIAAAAETLAGGGGAAGLALPPAKLCNGCKLPQWIPKAESAAKGSNPKEPLQCRHTFFDRISLRPKRFRHIHSEFLKRSAVPIMRLLVFVLIIL